MSPRSWAWVRRSGHRRPATIFTRQAVRAGRQLLVLVIPRAHPRRDESPRPIAGRGGQKVGAVALKLSAPETAPAGYLFGGSARRPPWCCRAFLAVYRTYRPQAPGHGDPPAGRLPPGFVPDLRNPHLGAANPGAATRRQGDAVPRQHRRVSRPKPTDSAVPPPLSCRRHVRPGARLTPPAPLPQPRAVRRQTPTKSEPPTR